MITSYGHGMDAFSSCSELSKSNIFDNKEFTRVCILPPKHDKSRDLVNTHNNSAQANGTDTNSASSWRNKAGTIIRIDQALSWLLFLEWVPIMLSFWEGIMLGGINIIYIMCGIYFLFLVIFNILWVSFF